MEKSIVFNNVHVGFEGHDDVLQVMYLHKGFAIVAMGGDDISFLPLEQSEKDSLLSDPLNIMEELDSVEDSKILGLLDGIIGDLDASVERAKITSG